MTRDSKTQSALLALARTRRMQRALAHAHLHRNASLSTLRSSLGFMTTTARVTEEMTDEADGIGHRMRVLGVARFDGIAYVVEDIGDAAPIVYRLYLRGPRQGHLVPLHAWYAPRIDDVRAYGTGRFPRGTTAPTGAPINEPPARLPLADVSTVDPREIHARLAALAPTLEPMVPTATEAWMLSTRIVQRRALRTAGSEEMPIRKFALQLVVEPVSSTGPSGRSTVTAFLQPHAQLTEVWSLASADGGTPRDLAIARVTYRGIPSGTGLSKDTVVLLTSSLYHGLEGAEA